MERKGNGVLLLHWIDDNETTLERFEDIDQMLHSASRIYAFSDLDDSLEIKGIYWNDKKLHYAGWQPDMLYEFKDESGEVVWRNWYPSWDH